MDMKRDLIARKKQHERGKEGGPDRTRIGKTTSKGQDVDTGGCKRPAEVETHCEIIIRLKRMSQRSHTELTPTSHAKQTSPSE